MYIHVYIYIYIYIPLGGLFTDGVGALAVPVNEAPVELSGPANVSNCRSTEACRKNSAYALSRGGFLSSPACTADSLDLNPEARPRPSCYLSDGVFLFTGLPP